MNKESSAGMKVSQEKEEKHVEARLEISKEPGEPGENDKLLVDLDINVDPQKPNEMKTCIKAEVVDDEMDLKAKGISKDADGEADIRAEIREGKDLHGEGNIHLDFVGKSEGSGQMSLRGKKTKPKHVTNKSTTKEKLVKGDKAVNMDESSTKKLMKKKLVEEKKVVKKDKSGTDKSKKKTLVKGKKGMKKDKSGTDKLKKNTLVKGKKVMRKNKSGANKLKKKPLVKGKKVMKRDKSGTDKLKKKMLVKEKKIMKKDNSGPKKSTKSGPKKMTKKEETEKMQVMAKKVLKKEFGHHSDRTAEGYSRKFGKVFHQGDTTYRWNPYKGYYETHPRYRGGCTIC